MEHINWTLGVIIPYINFFTFLIVAFFLFRKPLSQAAKKARDVFDKSSIEALQEKEMIQKKLQEMRGRSDRLEAELVEMRSVAEATLVTEEKALLEEGVRLAQHVREETKRVIEAEIEKVKLEMSRQIIDLVKNEVAERIKKDVGIEKQHQIVRESIVQLGTVQL